MSNGTTRLRSILSIFFLFAIVFSMHGQQQSKISKMSIDNAWEWYNSMEEIKGVNYVPRYAGNSTEMWQEADFRPDIIDQELSWAESVGYNSVRVFMQYLVWENDKKGTMLRMNEFMDIAADHGIKVMWVLFDDCAFGYPPKTEPYLGEQGEPLPGEYAPYWTPSPGHSIVDDKSQWEKFEKYIKDIISEFSDDDRILMWDLYNEPGMSGVGDSSMPLVEAAFEWARSVSPAQPLTVGVYQNDVSCDIPERFIELSDIITFHSYDNIKGLNSKMEFLAGSGRPLICTEFMIRRNGNDFFSCLPEFARANVGWFNWGLVQGKTQTWLPWDSKPWSSTPKRWQCDVMYSSGMPYDTDEIKLIRDFKFFSKYENILPTSEISSLTWHYVTDPPNYGWHLGASDFPYDVPFQGSVWGEAKAPFGSSDQGVNTKWDNNNIWLRRSFNLKEKPLNPYLRIKHDEEVEVYINGELAYKSINYTEEYELVPFQWRARASIKAGENIISVHCHKGKDSRGDQFIDVGIVDLLRKGEDHPPVLDTTNLVLSTDIDVGEIWSAEKAWEWYRSIPPTIGCNFLPSTAINSVEMWQAETFDPETIDKELGWAQNLGYNSVRVYLNYIVWESDPDGYISRIDQFLSIANKHNISTTLIFFDDCCFAMKLEPYMGQQDDPVPGVTNSGWVPSPGYSMVVDTTQYHFLEDYVKSVVSHFRSDKRVLMWDIYNEPGPFFDRSTSLVLSKHGMRWARELNPVQPVTIAMFGAPYSYEYCLLSDVVTAHIYGGPDAMEKFFLRSWADTKKPVLVTEWMLRSGESGFANVLPVFEKYNIGWYNWGFVGGRVQTWAYFGQVRSSLIKEIWMCDMVWPDGKPFDEKEIELIRNFRFIPFNLK